MGIHKSTTLEIQARFGTGSQQRMKLFKELLGLTKLLQKHKSNIKYFLLNGSFVCNKESPNDLDCILVVRIQR